MSTPPITPLPAPSSNTLVHVVYAALIAFLLFIGTIFVREHDARILAEQTVKTDEATVKTLQQTISEIQAAQARRVVVIQKEAAAIKTTPQAIPAIQDFDPKLNVRPLPAAPLDVQVAAVPLAQDIEQCKIDRVNLDSCTQIQAKQAEVIASKDSEIKALKRKPRFWKRVGSTLKTVGIGVAIGVTIALIAVH